MTKTNSNRKVFVEFVIEYHERISLCLTYKETYGRMGQDFHKHSSKV